MSESLSLSDAQTFLHDHYGDRASQLKPLGSGDWSKAYAFTLDGNEVVARFGPHGEDFTKDQVMSDFSSPGLPIPKVLEVGEAPNGFFTVSDRAYGDFLDGLSETDMREVLHNLFKALDATKEIDISGTSGYGVWMPDGRAPHSSWQDALLDVVNDRSESRTHGWRQALESSTTGTKPFDTAFAVLRDLAPDLPGERHVVHADWMYHNVLVAHGHISAVLDWGNSMYGDYLYDAAWLIFCWAWSPQLAGIDIRRELDEHWAASGSVPADLEQRLLAYQIHIGLGAQAYNALTGHHDNLAISVDQTMKLLDNARRGR